MRVGHNPFLTEWSLRLPHLHLFFHTTLRALTRIIDYPFTLPHSVRKNRNSLFQDTP